MPTVWFALKKSFQCKSDPVDVHEPKARGHLNSLLSRNGTYRSGCSRSIANLKDVIHGGRRFVERPTSCSPRSIGSSDLLNPIAHEVVFGDSRCEFKITGFRGFGHESGEGGMEATYVGTLRPGTPGPGGRGGSSTLQRKPHAELIAGKMGCSFPGAVHGNGGRRNASLPSRSPAAPSETLTCHRCGEQFRKLEALEAHHLSKHAVTELLEGDSSRKIVEIICKANWLKNESSCGRIEKILKVHNMQKMLSRFEEYREMVKIRASKLPKKHPRCIADGNELLRFYGTTISCSLGTNGSSNLCDFDNCSVCRILKHGFSVKKEVKCSVGVFTTSTSSRALDSVQVFEHYPSTRKALLVCRVIAGRMHKPLENLQTFSGQSGFDSVAGKVGPYANIEELYLLNTRALFPCFVVICRT